MPACAWPFIRVLTFPLDLIPLAKQANTIIQDKSRQRAKSHLISPMSPNVAKASVRVTLSVLIEK